MYTQLYANSKQDAEQTPSRRSSSTLSLQNGNQAGSEAEEVSFSSSPVVGKLTCSSKSGFDISRTAELAERALAAMSLNTGSDSQASVDGGVQVVDDGDAISEADTELSDAVQGEPQSSTLHRISTTKTEVEAPNLLEDQAEVNQVRDQHPEDSSQDTVTLDTAPRALVNAINQFTSLLKYSNDQSTSLLKYSNNQVRSIGDRLGRVEKALENVQKDLKDVRTRVDGTHNTVDQLQGQLHQLDVVVSARNYDIGQFGKGIKEMKDIMTSESTSVKQTLENQSARLQDHAHTLEGNAATMHNLIGSVDLVATKQEQVIMNSNDLTNTIREVEAMVATSTTHVKGMTSKVEDLNGSTTRVIAKQEVCYEVINDMATQVYQAKGAIGRNTDTVAEVKKALLEQNEGFHGMTGVVQITMQSVQGQVNNQVHLDNAMQGLTFSLNNHRAEVTGIANTGNAIEVGRNSTLCDIQKRLASIEVLDDAANKNITKIAKEVTTISSNTGKILKTSDKTSDLVDGNNVLCADIHKKLGAPTLTPVQHIPTNISHSGNVSTLIKSPSAISNTTGVHSDHQTSTNDCTSTSATTSPSGLALPNTIFSVTGCFVGKDGGELSTCSTLILNFATAGRVQSIYDDACRVWTQKYTKDAEGGTFELQNIDVPCCTDAVCSTWFTMTENREYRNWYKRYMGTAPLDVCSIFVHFKYVASTADGPSSGKKRKSSTKETPVMSKTNWE